MTDGQLPDGKDRREYGAECSDCPKMITATAYGTAEKKILDHMDETGHSVPQPEQVEGSL